MKIHQLLIVLVISGSVALGLFNNCGSSKSGGEKDQASRSDSSPVDGSSGGTLTDCNQIPSNSMDLEGPVSTFIDSQTGNVINEVIRLKFNDYPFELLSTSSYYIQIFKWKEEVAGSPSYDPNPVKMYFQLKDTGGWVQDDPVTVLSKASIATLIQDNNMGIPPENFFNAVVINLDELDLQWDAITIALYDENRGTEAIDQVSLLLPAFAADPNRYETNHPPNLVNMHPLITYKDSGMTEAQFYQSAQSLCLGF